MASTKRDYFIQQCPFDKKYTNHQTVLVITKASWPRCGSPQASVWLCYASSFHMKSRSYRTQNTTRRSQTHAQCFCKRHKTYTEDNGKSTFPLSQTTGSLQRKLFLSCSLTAPLPPRTLHLLLTESSDHCLHLAQMP